MVALTQTKQTGYGKVIYITEKLCKVDITYSNLCKMRLFALGKDVNTNIVYVKLV